MDTRPKPPSSQRPIGEDVIEERPGGGRLRAWMRAVERPMDRSYARPPARPLFERGFAFDDANRALVDRLLPTQLTQVPLSQYTQHIFAIVAPQLKLTRVAGPFPGSGHLLFGAHIRGC